MYLLAHTLSMSIQWSKEVKLLLLIATSVLLLASLGLLIAESVGKKKKTKLAEKTEGEAE